MILFLHGEDAFLVNRRRRALQKAFAKKYPEAEIFVFDFEDQSSAQSVGQALAACEEGLFATKKMVILLHPNVLPEHEAETLLAFLKAQKKNPVTATLLFVIPEKIKKTDKVTAQLLKLSEKTESFENLSERRGKKKIPDARKIEGLITKELSRIDPKLSFDREALRLFIAIVGDDTARLVSELEKLSAYKPGGEIGAGDVALLLSAEEEEFIFEALDALSRGNRERALALFSQASKNKDGYFSVLALCAWQVRNLLMVREAVDQGLSQSGAIASRTRLAPFVVEKTQSIIGSFPIPRIKRGLALLSRFDTALKRSAIDPAVALDLFVWKF